jgi:hypothetical protein
LEAEIDANYIYADGKPLDGWKAWEKRWNPSTPDAVPGEPHK